jgi:hypothetical protein
VFLKCVFFVEKLSTAASAVVSLGNLTKKQCFAAIVNRKKLKLIVHRLDFKLRVKRVIVRYSALQSKSQPRMKF